MTAVQEQRSLRDAVIRPTVQKRRRKGPECKSGIKGRGLKQQLRLGSERTFNKTIRQTLGLAVVKRAVEISIRWRKVSVWTL
jgi:hypothetical protein